MNPIFSHLLIGLICFLAGIFVYRNNRDLFAPFAAKIDETFDELKDEIKELREEMKKK